MRIKAICITVPLSFPVPFICPHTSPLHPIHTYYSFLQTNHTIPHLSIGKLSSRLVRRRRYILFSNPYSGPHLFSFDVDFVFQLYSSLVHLQSKQITFHDFCYLFFCFVYLVHILCNVTFKVILCLRIYSYIYTP